MDDARLSPLVNWPERHQLWHTMPMCFKYSFGDKVTAIIDCFEVNFLMMVQKKMEPNRMSGEQHAIIIWVAKMKPLLTKAVLVFCSQHRG